MVDRDWNLAELAAWVIWRRLDEVQKYRDEPTSVGDVLQRELTYRSYREIDSDFVPVEVAAETARDEIKQVLQNGGRDDHPLVAQGMWGAEIMPRPVPPEFWPSALIELNDAWQPIDKRRYHHAVFRKDDPEPAIEHVCVRAKHAMDIWKPLLSADELGPTVIGSAEATESTVAEQSPLDVDETVETVELTAEPVASPASRPRTRVESAQVARDASSEKKSRRQEVVKPVIEEAREAKQPLNPKDLYPRIRAGMAENGLLDVSDATLKRDIHELFPSIFQKHSDILIRCTECTVC